MSIRAKSADGVYHEFPDGTDPAVIDGAMKKYAATPYAKARTEATASEARYSGPARAMQHAQTFGFDDELGGAGAALRTAVGNTFNRVRGKPVPYSVGDAYHANVDARRDLNAEFSRDHSIQESLIGLVSAPVKEAGGIALKAGSGLLKTAAKGGLFGGAFGALSGAGNAQSAEGASLPQVIADRAGGAGRGAAVGTLMGAAIPTAIAGGAAGVRGVGGAGRTTLRAVNRATGGRMLDPAKEASARLAEAMRKDGLSPAQIQAAHAEWTANGVTPAFLDVAGENTRALVRAAGTQGPARSAAVKYAKRTAGDLQENAINLTRRLTPDTRPANAVAAHLEQTQGNLANTQYRQPYAEQVPIPHEVASVLQDAPGKAALRAARADAVERRLTAQVAEIDALLSDKPPATVSAATLDRVKIATGERGGKLARQGNNSRAGGAFERKGIIDSSLDNVPGLDHARGTFRSMQAQRDALDLGQTALNASPDEYASALQPHVGPLAPEVQQAAGIGHRQAITDAIGAPAAGATGLLNRLGSGTNQGRNLATSFGPAAAERYQGGIENLTDQAKNAQFINPNTGAKTAGALEDQGLVSMPKMRPVDMLLGVMDKIRRGATLTDAERELIVQFGTQAPGQTLSALPPQKAPGPRLSPFFFPAIGEMAGRR